MTKDLINDSESNEGEALVDNGWIKNTKSEIKKRFTGQDDVKEILDRIGLKKGDNFSNVLELPGQAKVTKI